MDKGTGRFVKNAAEKGVGDVKVYELSLKPVWNTPFGTCEKKGSLLIPRPWDSLGGLLDIRVKVTREHMGGGVYDG